MDLKNKQRLRLAFLNELYESSNLVHNKTIFGGDIATKIGMTNMEEAYDVVKYLINEGLVIDSNLVSKLPGYVEISHYGIKEVQSANLNPDKSTNHFLPMNVLFVNNMIGSSIQQGTSYSHQTTSSSNVDSLENLTNFINELDSKLYEITLPENLRQELQSDIDTIKIQLKSPKPKLAIIKGILESSKNIIESSVGGIISSQLTQKISTIMATL